ncbi:MAG: methyltransferase domain-containing protein [Limisphaerales bacterium]
MRAVKCNLCGADDYMVRFPKGVAQLHRIVQCNRCGLMYANPQELVNCECYESDAHPKVFDEVEARQYLQKQHVQLPDSEKALRVLNGFFPQRGKLLEIGSYCGIFLDRIRADGWEVMGLEPDPAAADYSRSRYGLTITGRLLPNPDLADRTFDAVVMLHVIEHMPDPSESLAAIHRVLKPGGVLVAETPRFDSLMFKLLGRRERSLANCDGHIFFFTVTTLRKMFEKCGFEVVRSDLVGRTLTWERLFYNIGVITHSSRIQRWLASLSATLHLDRFRIHINARDIQRIYGRAT